MDEIILKSIIKKATIKSVVNYFDKNIKEEKVRKFQILDLLMPKERKIRSIVGGLETAMGKTLWEPLAKEIASGNGFDVINKDLQSPTNMPSVLANTLQTIIATRVANTGMYDARSSHDTIKHFCQQFIVTPISNFENAPRGFGVDIWLKKDGINYFFDTKTVQPNVGNYNKFLSQILNWYAYFYSQNPLGNAEARIVFPYNPHNGEDFWKKTMGAGKPLERGKEGWVENEFWDFLSGYTNTFQLIKESFNDIYIEGSLENQLDIVFDRNKEIIAPIPDQI
ncbi:TdeIII family type II restriction endonuclease [Pedobacter sp. L105]|uniref:TdeIII family type II restriction endonuclease n=1 Tax=Pedobacter sp. L105 TaxID=1641871 RepID=UPI00131E53A3|nr:TdeIII family type II restriction endonuclease [Pedobacter sp. L105]